MDHEKIGTFIAQLRRERGLTQKELAQCLSVTDKAVSRWETGKGLPDTATLPELARVLEVSLEELLQGQRQEQPQPVLQQERTDALLLEALRYSRKSLLPVFCSLGILLGALLMLYTVGSPIPNVVGLWMILLSLLFLFWKGGDPMKREKRFRLAACGALLLALLLEILPYGAVLVFAPGPGERVVKTFSYFDLTPYGYANFGPLFTGVCTVLALLLLLLGLLRKEKGGKQQNAAFFCVSAAVVFSLLPLMFGAQMMNAVSYLVTVTLLLSAAFLAVVNRKLRR